MRQTSSLRNQQQVRNYSTPPGAGNKKEQKYEEKDEKNKEKMYTQAEVDEIIYILRERMRNWRAAAFVVGVILGVYACENGLRLKKLF